ncbi:MAG: formylglycine-generating enzyme family protein, partial [Bryobacterales bacterium]|nr:formylglycine-generating enzyme family protein [Bryobacterales bacterium]
TRGVPLSSPAYGAWAGRGYWLGKYEVTQSEWKAVMGTTPSTFSGCGQCPVEYVSWNDAQAFVGQLNERPGVTRYRLPTEAEWEYAARAGTARDRYGNVDAIGWCGHNSGFRTHPVGQKMPNAWGLHDMMGNVNEWVQDWYGRYQGGSLTDSRGTESGSHRVARGGAWNFGLGYCRSAARYYADPGALFGGIGFRLLRTE